ncbi:ABATE domain-containing protein [Thermobifida halotolerans]|uniref:ABATE domain-containing protein n=1 Tax=Thermobifida halotolerans TaxID=483545 RepID=A0A399G7V2_9ACTN|nr:ABATE domain-containing protein [Thermobifida halotolerans]UOE20799.1 ABATE domain-containing protein [Thermobifida halotolerans]
MSRSATGLVLRSPEGTEYVFDPGALCLELLTTGGPGVFTRYEVLHEPADLARWVALSRLGLTAADVGVDEAELVRARKLRDALWRLVRARTHGRPLADGEVAVLNRAAAGVPLVPRVTPTGERGWRTPASGTQVVATVARDAVELLTGPFADRVRECAAHDCHLVFVDTSRPGRRRWCSMERCGNRNKVRALRARRQADSA